MRNPALALAALLALAGYAPTTNAATMDVSYTAVTIVSVPGIGPLGPPAFGSATVRYTAAPGGVISGPTGTILHGPATLLGGSFAGPLGFTAAGDLFTGMATGTLIGAPGGVLASSGTLMLPIGGFVGGTLHCSGGTCPILGFTPSVINPLAFPFTATLVAPGAATIGSSLFFTFTFLPFTAGTLGGAPITASITFSEIPGSRHFVPEPNTAVLFGLGLVALAGAGRAARRMQR